MGNNQNKTLKLTFKKKKVLFPTIFQVLISSKTENEHTTLTLGVGTARNNIRGCSSPSLWETKLDFSSPGHIYKSLSFVCPYLCR